MTEHTYRHIDTHTVVLAGYSLWGCAHTQTRTQTHTDTHTKCAQRFPLPGCSTLCQPSRPPLKCLPHLAAGVRPLTLSAPSSLTLRVSPLLWPSLDTPSLRLLLLLGPSPAPAQACLSAPPPMWNTAEGLGAQVTRAFSRFWAWGPGMEAPETWVLAFPSVLGSAASTLCLFRGVCQLPW